MKTIEALISLVVLLSFTSLSLIEPPQAHSMLCQHQLAEDVWRVTYLKGCFSQSTPEDMGPGIVEGEMRECFMREVAPILEDSRLDVSFDQRIPVIIGDYPSEDRVVITKTIIINGIPERATLSVG